LAVDEAHTFEGKDHLVDRRRGHAEVPLHLPFGGRSAIALYQSFPAAEARRVLRRLEFHYVPKHASWLNMVEIEIGVLASQCLDRRIESYARLVAETAAWEKRRNAERARIKWMFTTEKARSKMGRAYPRPDAKSAPAQRVKTFVRRY
jgi:hypothetical protein